MDTLFIILLLVVEANWEYPNAVELSSGPVQYVTTIASADRSSNTNNVLGSIELVSITPGTFIIGSSEDELGHRINESPQTKVTIDYKYWMGKYEVSVKQYKRLIGKYPERQYFNEDNMPLNYISWNEAMRYCYQLTIEERNMNILPKGYEYRLPTEAEWEYACRAGTTTRFSFGNDTDYSLLREYECCANIIAGAVDAPMNVGSKHPNPWGLYDMHGGVHEWCLDWLGEKYPGGTLINPVLNAPSYVRVYRGGSYLIHVESCRSAFRHAINCKRDIKAADTPVLGVGFRVVLAPALTDNLYK